MMIWLKGSKRSTRSFSNSSPDISEMPEGLAFMLNFVLSLPRVITGQRNMQFLQPWLDLRCRLFVQAEVTL